MANDTFQKFKSSVNRGITAISVKTSSTLEKTKIKTHIDSLEKEVEKCYHNIGKEAYEIWTNGGSDFSSLTDKFEEIKKRKSDIENLICELSSIDERDNEILGNMEGSQEQQAATEQASAKFVCANCGAQYTAAVKFCRNCGNKME